ncbi:alpha/beta hydrolase [Naviculisporaceae sp. PSN 640]
MSSSSPSSAQSNPWIDAPERSGLVSIGTHSLHLSISGPPCRFDSLESDKEIPNELVIIFTGAGDLSLSWTPVLRLFQASSTNSPAVPPPRILICDRSGLGRSERGPNRLTAAIAATEILAALRSTSLMTYHRSLILVAHSYGAIVAREFIHLFESEAPQAVFSSSGAQSQTEYSTAREDERCRIKALILVDPATEKQHLSFPPPLPNPDFVALLGTLNFARVTGLRENAKLSTEEWRARAAAMSSPSHQAATQEEVSNYVEVCETLGEKRQIERQVLGTRPLVVIQAESWREYEAVYEAGVEAGHGSEEERRRFKELVDGWEEKDRVLKEEVLGLSSVKEVQHVTALKGETGSEIGEEERNTCSKKMVLVKGCGHNVQLLRPDVIVREVYSVLGTIRRDGSWDMTGEPRL